MANRKVATSLIAGDVVKTDAGETLTVTGVRPSLFSHAVEVCFKGFCKETGKQDEGWEMVPSNMLVDVVEA